MVAICETDVVMATSLPLIPYTAMLVVAIGVSTLFAMPLMIICTRYRPIITNRYGALSPGALLLASGSALLEPA